MEAPGPRRRLASIATATETFSPPVPQGRRLHEYLHNLKRAFVAGCNCVIWMSNHFEGRGGRGQREVRFIFYRVFRGNCMLCGWYGGKSLCGTNAKASELVGSEMKRVPTPFSWQERPCFAFDPALCQSILRTVYCASPIRVTAA
jgi:hypothetical protein